MDVHYPFFPPGEYVLPDDDRTISKSRAVELNGKMHEDEQFTEAETADLLELYRGDVRYIDRYLDELISEFKSRDLYRDTLFVATSDHGELFGEHEMFGHPQNAYNEGIHVPLIVFGEEVPNGETVDTPVSLIDLPPTLADSFDLGAEESWSGENLWSYVGASATEPRRIFSGSDSIIGTQTSEYRLVWWRESHHPVNPADEWELLSVETGNRIPLDWELDEVKGHREALEAFIEQSTDIEKFSEPETDRDTQQQLEALGYR
jgi:arylsulfatase A-like enzyme